jgi:hypothetical protein
MGNINCCKKPSEEKVLEAFEEVNKNDDCLPFDSSPNYQNDKVKEIKEINNNSYNIYENKDLVKEGNTYNVEINYLNQMNDQKNINNENEDINLNQFKTQHINDNYRENENEKDYKAYNDNFNKNNKDLKLEQKLEEGDFNRIGYNQNDLIKSPIKFSLGFQGQQILENSDVNSFGLRYSNNYNLSPNLENNGNIMNKLEQRNELQKRVIDLSQSNYNNNKIDLNKINIENSNVNSETNYINNIDIFNSAFTFGGSQQNNRNNIADSNIILGQSLNSNDSLNFHNSDIMIN